VAHEKRTVHGRMKAPPIAFPLKRDIKGEVKGDVGSQAT